MLCRTFGADSASTSATTPPPGRQAMSTPRSSSPAPVKSRVTTPSVPKPATGLPSGSRREMKVSSRPPDSPAPPVPPAIAIRPLTGSTAIREGMSALPLTGKTTAPVPSPNVVSSEPSGFRRTSATSRSAVARGFAAVAASTRTLWSGSTATSSALSSRLPSAGRTASSNRPSSEKPGSNVPSDRRAVIAMSRLPPFRLSPTV